MQSSDATFKQQIKVSLEYAVGDDLSLLHAARVSTGTNTGVSNERDERLMNYLIGHKHGSPFEHASMTFLVQAPLFVWHEHMRHRIGWSYNQESARYKEMEPVFYVPEDARVQTGNPGNYRISRAENYGDTMLTQTELMANAVDSYTRYKRLLERGIAREMARMVLPVNLMSWAYTTCNPRSMMNFLALRTDPSAQHEIRLVAAAYEAEFKRLFPLTHAAWEKYGRVAP